MTLTAATLKRDVLDPSLDAIALNRQQERLFFNASPEIDSLLELFNEVAPREPAHAAAGLRILTQAVAANQLELDSEQRIAGFADRTTTELRHAQLNGAGAGVSLKRVARVARSVVGAVVRNEAPSVEELAAFRWLVIACPSSHLLANAVAHDLGRKRFELWQRIINDEEARAGDPSLLGHSGAAPDDLATV